MSQVHLSVKLFAHSLFIFWIFVTQFQLFRPVIVVVVDNKRYDDENCRFSHNIPYSLRNYYVVTY